MSAESLERYFRMMQGGRRRRPSGRLWNPPADVYRTRDGWVVKVDLAGVSPADVEITMNGSILRVSGLRRDRFCGEGISHYQLEITYSRFEKTIQFPSSIEGSTIVKDYRDGLLILELQEKEERAGAANAKSRAAGEG